MIAWKEYSRFEVISLSEWSERREKEGWEILEFFVEDHTDMSSNVQQGQTYTIDTTTHITLPVVVPSTYSSHRHKFLIGQNKTYDVLFAKVK